MSRDLSTDLAAALDDPVVMPVLLFDAEFVTGWLYLWSGVGDLVWNGHTYTGVGSLIGLSAVEESGEVRATGITVTLAGLDTGITSIALQELAQNKTGVVRFGLFALDDVIGDGDGIVGEMSEAPTGLPGGSWIGSGPEVVFSGRLDLGTIHEEAGAATVTISYESRIVNLETPRLWAWTDQDQQATYPGDLGCKATGPIADQVLQWGG